MRVLVVEDDRKVADALRDGLTAEGYEVDVDESCRLIHTIRGVGFMMHAGEP